VIAAPSLDVGSFAAAGIDPADARALHDALAGLPGYATAAPSITRLTGGLTNRSYRVDAAGAPSVVVRLSEGKSSLLAIDRVAECANLRAAVASGAAPAVLRCDPVAGVTVVEWIDGHTFEPADLDDSAQLARVAALCRTLHAGPRFVNDFEMFAVQRDYLDVVRRHDFRLPPRYEQFAPQVAAMSSALAAGAEGTVPCHNDLLAANIVDDGTRLWFIDYEYAGNNDPCFELGNIWSEAALPAHRLTELVTAYYGRPRPDRVARARLFALLAQYAWTLWASIQDAVSDADFDFWAWGMDKYERAVETFDSPLFDQLVADAQTPPM
jgi:thiamine kinase-like enzyme